MLGSTIRRELAVIILRDLDDARLSGLPTVTRVRVSPDLSIADVYVTVMGTEGAQTAALNALRHSAGLMRTKLSDSLSLRVAPFLKFHLDEQLRKELGVLDALKRARAEMGEGENTDKNADGEAADEGQASTEEDEPT